MIFVMKKTITVLMLLGFILSTQAQKKQVSSVNQNPSVPKVVKLYTTADNSNLRLTLTETLSFVDLVQPVESQICVFVDPTKKFQTLLGIGGALTDASAETFYKLPKDKQDEIMKAYYDKEDGIGYSLARTNINSCDFSSGSYTYVEDNDKDLKTFSIQHDLQFKVPFIKRAVSATSNHLTMFVSPWSPPAWMKDNNDMLHGGKLKPEYSQTWANYFVKFIKTYEVNGIPIWGLSVQNEPMAKQKWESCIYTATDEKDFVKKYLGPTLKKEQLGDKKIIVWDHNRDLLYQQASEILNDKDAAQYIWGVGFHWYEDWSGGVPMFENVRKVKESFPEKNLMFTEGCNGNFKLDSVYNWKLGERYGLSMINDFNNGTVGWTDWNILLDETGGPNHVQNFCYAPIHADIRTGKLIYTNSFYYIGHFSKFIRPGAKRITSSASKSVLSTTAFQNPDGKIVVVVMNSGDKKVPYFLWMDKKAAPTVSMPHSITTLVIE
jgi:glucosylceramidase